MSWNATRCLTLALAVSVPLCAGALLTRPVQAAPISESDENGPLVQIIKPGYNDVLKGKYRILIQVTARKYNPQSVEMFVDDVSATNGPMDVSSFASSSYDFDTRLLSDGPHKLTVRITDSQGFRGWSEVTVFVNNKGVFETQAPDLRWSGLEQFQEVSGSLKLEVAPAQTFGIKMLKISISPADTPGKESHSWFMNQPPYRIDFDTVKKNIPDGLYVVKALAWDSLDQQGQAPPLTIGIINDQINATRVQDMLKGQKQMRDILKDEKQIASAPTSPAPGTSPTERPATVLPARPVPNRIAPPTVVDAAPNRTAAPPAQSRAVPAFSNPAPTFGQNSPQLLPPDLNATQSRPAIQVPRVPMASMPQSAQPRSVAPTASPQAGKAGDVDNAPTANETITVEDATPVATTTQPSEAVRVASVPSLPIGKRNAGEASLSRATAVELALAPASDAMFESARSLDTIPVARLGQPHLSGRMITGAPVLSQNANSEDSRLSSLEPPRVRSSRAQTLDSSGPVQARALQTSAPALIERGAASQAPALIAKNQVASAPQMSATAATTMSESAAPSVPSPVARVIQRMTDEGQTRVAELPRPAAGTRNRSGAIIVAAPLDAPLAIAAPTTLTIPTSYRAQRDTTLRAIAARFGLPVELVALSNNWTPDMKVVSGMEVKLPRPLQVSYKGRPVTGDSPSMLMDGTAVTAFRFVFEKSGGTIEWDAANQRVVARKDGREITLTIGSNVAQVGEREVAMEIAAFLFQGRTMVPLRFFEEGLNAQVEWNPQTGRIVVAMAG